MLKISGDCSRNHNHNRSSSHPESHIFRIPLGNHNILEIRAGIRRTDKRLSLKFCGKTRNVPPFGMFRTKECRTTCQFLRTVEVPNPIFYSYSDELGIYHDESQYNCKSTELPAFPALFRIFACTSRIDLRNRQYYRIRRYVLPNSRSTWNEIFFVF